MTEHEEGEQKKFAAQCRAHLVAHVEALDPAIQSRLARARERALTQGRETATARPFRVPGAWLPVGVVALAASLALAVWISRPVPAAAPSAEAAAVEDVDWLVSGEETDFYADDAAFYEWAGNASEAS
jgi:hypothetical protein